MKNLRNALVNQGRNSSPKPKKREKSTIKPHGNPTQGTNFLKHYFTILLSYISLLLLLSITDLSIRGGATAITNL